MLNIFRSKHATKPVFFPGRLKCIAVMDSGRTASCASEYFWHYSELLIDPEDGQLYIMGSKDRFYPVRENWHEIGYQVYMPLDWDRFPGVLDECESADPEYRNMNSSNWRDYVRNAPPAFTADTGHG